MLDLRPTARACRFLAATALLAGSAGAQTYRLSPPFERAYTVGSVSDFRVHPSGTQVLFRADARRAGVLELYRAPIDGGTRPRPVVQLPVDRAVTSYELSSDGQWLVYTADREQDEHFELYSHRVGSIGSTRLSGAGLIGDVSSFSISPDGTRVFYLAETQPSVSELFSVRIAGGFAPVKLNAPLVAGGDVDGFTVSPSGARVVYWADQEQRDHIDLYSVAASGGAPVKLSTPLTASFNAMFRPARITADGSTVVFCSIQSRVDLFRVPLLGGASPVRIHDPLPPLDAPGVTAFELSADGRHVAYLATPDIYNHAEVYSAPLDGSGGPVKLNSPLHADQTIDKLLVRDSSRAVFLVASSGSNGYFVYSAPLDGSAPALLLDQSRAVFFLDLSPDGRHAVYYRTATADLRSAAVDGSTPPVRLDDPGGVLGPTPTFGRQPFVISPDSSRVLYVWGVAHADLEGQGLYSVPIDRSAGSTQLAAGDVDFGFGIDPSSTRAVFRVAREHDQYGPFELFSAPLTGGVPVRLSAELARVSGDDVDAFALDAPGPNAVFSVSGRELLRTRADGSTGPLTLAAEGDFEVQRFQLTSDRTRVVYLHRDASASELRAVPADGSAAPITIATQPSSYYEPLFPDFQISADGARVVYRARPSSFSTTHELWVASILGTGQSLLASGSIQWFGLTPDGGRVLYIANTKLVSVPIDGSASPVTLSEPGPVSVAHVTPDSSRVLFLRQHFDPVFDVCVAPVDGSVATSVLSLARGLDVDFQLSPDGRWVVFSTQTLGGVAVDSARVDGSSAPVPLGLGRLAAITPDSARVVFVGNDRALRAAAIDGSASPLELSGPMVAGGGVRTATDIEDPFQFAPQVSLTPDGTRVLYVADQLVDERYELFSVPLDGSASPVKLSRAMVAGGGVKPITDDGPGFQVSADSSRVVYSADARAVGLWELYVVPVDGSAPPLRLNEPLAIPGVSTFEIGADSSGVVYRATEQSGVTELFASRFPVIPQQRHLQPH